MISRNNRGDDPEEWSPCGRTSFQTRTTGIYRSMISEWRRQSKSAGLWQYQTFRHGPILLFFLFLFFFRVLRSFGRGHMRCVRLEWRTDWIDCECSLFTPCSWLRRRNVKQSSVASAALSEALHGLPEADHSEQRIEYRTRNSEAGCSIPSLASDCG